MLADTAPLPPTSENQVDFQTKVDWRSLSGVPQVRRSIVTQLSEKYRGFFHSKLKRREMVLITGPSGAGKTSLAFTLENEVAEDGGYMISGKFDPLGADLKATALAYEEFAEAFSEYIDMVVSKGETEVHLLKGAIMEKIDYTELQVLHEIIPSLGRIVDVQQLPSSEKPTLILKGADAEDRLIQIFIRLVRTVCTLGVPIILFLDDLQWADPCCLHLLTSLLLSEDAAEWQLMLICSCRTSEVSVDHPFSSMLRDVEDQGVILTEIKVSHLTKDDVTDLIHFTFPMEQSELRSLSNIVFQQTDGNLLFVIQLLKSMHEEKVLNLSNSGWWTWDKENVLVTSDIVSMARLFERKVSSLGENVQEVLRTASCLGSTFSTAALSFVGVVAVDDVVEILHKLEQVGLIALQNKSNARFVHHKVYEFVYHLSPGSELKQMHLDIGRKLRKAIPTDLFDDHLILVAQQISLGVDLIDDPAEKRAVAELFFRAGQKAALSAAFTTASAYLSLGISLLDGHWQDHYTLSLAMYNCAAEVEYYNGNMQRVDALVGTVLMNANTFEDTLPSQFTRIYSLGSREMLAQGLEENLNVLRKLGENFQRKPHIFHILHELIQCKRFLRAKTDDDILNLPKMRHNKKHAMRFMILAALFATYVSSSHVPLIAFRAIKYTMRYGMSEMACVGFGMLSAIFAFQGKIDEAYRFSRLAVRIFDAYQAKEWQARVAVVVYAFVYPMKRPFRDCLPPLLAAHRSSLVLGDIHFSMLCFNLWCSISYSAGVCLAQVTKEMQQCRALCIKYRQHSVQSTIELRLQLVLNLTGQTSDPLELKGEFANEEVAFQAALDKNPVNYVWMHVHKLQLAVYMNNLAAADIMLERLQRLDRKKLLPFTIVLLLFFEGLASAMSSSPKHRKRTKKTLRKLKYFARHSPSNYLNKVYFLEAEMASAAANHEQAMTNFNLSITLSQGEGLVQDQALACERAAYALVKCQRLPEANEYMQRAQALYMEWGAQAKVEQLAALSRF